MPQLDVEKSLKHEAVRQMLATAIASNSYKAGQRLPSVRELAKRYRVSIAPVCRAVDELAREGILRKISGHGIFVAETPSRPKAVDTVAIVYEGAKHQKDGGASKLVSQMMMESFVEASRGRAFEARIITHKPVETGSEDTELLEILSRFKVVLFPDATYLYWTKYLESRGCHVLYMGTSLAMPGTNRIRANLGGGVEALTEYLIDQGHKQILFVDALRANLGYPANAKFVSYCLAMQRRGLPSSFLPLDAGYEIDGYRAVREACESWSMGSRPTAIIGGNDMIACGILKAVGEAGLRVPEEISVAGIDDRPEASQTDPPLTTVARNYEMMAEAAVDWVAEALSDQPVRALDRLIPSRLVVRRSTAPPSRR